MDEIRGEVKMSEVKEAEPNYITWDEHRRSIRYLEEDIRNLKKQIKFLVAVLVDKKLIGEQIAKSFTETAPKEVIEWFTKKLEKK